jgi:hypothetical protein
VDGSVFLVVGNNTLADAVFHDQVRGEELDEVLGVVAKRLAVDCNEDKSALNQM